MFTKYRRILTIIEGSVEDLIVENNIVKGLILENSTKLFSKSVVLTTGTFLRGLIRIGSKQYSQQEELEKNHRLNLPKE